MKAIRVHAFGGPEVMQIEDIPVPEPGPGMILVRQAFIGVNYADISQREGRAQGGGTQYETDLPYSPGNEAAGEVAAIGPDITGFSIGDRVAYRGIFGAYAQYAAVPAASLVPVPEGLAFDTAAASLTHGMTAHYVTHDAYPVGAGDWVLVHAAAGGSGGLVVQMAKQRGATVVATASTEAKLARARENGADHAISYSDDNWPDAIRAIPGFTGFHAALDNVGVTVFEQTLALMRPRGSLVLFGMSSGAIPPFDLQRLNGLGSLSIRRANLKHYVLTREALLARAEAVFAMLLAGTVRVRIDRVLPLSDAAEAHRAVKSRATMGKVLLQP